MCPTQAMKSENFRHEKTHVVVKRYIYNKATPQKSIYIHRDPSHQNRNERKEQEGTETDCEDALKSSCSVLLCLSSLHVVSHHTYCTQLYAHTRPAGTEPGLH